MKLDTIVKGGTVGSATGGTYAGVSGLIQAGANFGTWDGPGLMTSRPDAAGGLLVEGVPGSGEDFMLARAAPAPLPDRVLQDVRELGAAHRVQPGLRLRE